MPRLIVPIAAASAAALASVALAPGAAPAQQATPAPGCQGVQLADKRGDSGQPTTDIVNVFYLTTGGKTTANLQVRDLKPEVPEGSTHWYWYMNYDLPDGQRYRLVAYLRGDGSTGFKARRFNDIPDPGGGVYSDVGTVPGRIFPGKDGVIQWELTDAIGGGAGAKLSNHFAAADEVVAGEPYAGTPYLRVVDSIDDTTDVKSTEYEVKDCPPDAPAGTPTPDSGAPTPPPSQDPGTQPPSSGDSQQGEPASRKQSAKKKCMAKAKKVKNKKKRAKAMKRCKKKGR